MEKKVKHDTSLFKISEIAEKDNAIASIENKSTCTKVTDIEIKALSDKARVFVYENRKVLEELKNNKYLIVRFDENTPLTSDAEGNITSAYKVITKDGKDIYAVNEKGEFTFYYIESGTEYLG